MSRSVKSNALYDLAARACRDVDAWNPELLDRDRNYGCRRRSAHISQCYDCRRWLFLCQHGCIILKALRVFSPDGFPVIYKIGNPHPFEVFLDPRENLIVMTVAQFRVVVEKNFPLL